MQNNANVAVTGLAFVAVAQLRQAPGYDPVKIFTTDVIPIAIEPSATADVRVDLVAQAEWMQLETIAPKVHVMCALAKVNYSNGAVWEVTPNPAARTAHDASSFPPAEVSRNLVSAGATMSKECRDDRGGTYSAGALVTIRNEPGTFAECALVSPPQARERTVRWNEHKPTRR